MSVDPDKIDDDMPDEKAAEFVEKLVKAAEDAATSNPAEEQQVKQPDQPKPRQPQAMSADQQLDFFLNVTANHNIRGMVAITSQFPPETALPAIARSYAMVISHLLSVGDLGPILRLRASVKKAFEEGINKIPIQPAPPPQGIKPGLMNGGAR
jgi:hypothetical protein